MENKIKAKVEYCRLVVPGVKCPLCGYPLVIIPHEVLSPQDEDAEVYKRDDIIILSIEQICQNPKCKYDRIMDYIITVSPEANSNLTCEAISIG